MKNSMQRQRPLRILLALATLWLLLTGSVVQAQLPRQIRITGVERTEGESTLQLQLHFTLQDETQKPITDAEFEAAYVVLPDLGGVEFPATITRPAAPLNVALLLDLSGSVVNNIDKVRTAAKQGLDNAPRDARFEVAKFSGTYSLIQPMSANRDQIRSAIDATGTPEGATCLYDTILWTLNRFASDLQSRNMIVVFTDGRDRANAFNDEPCSKATYTEVVARSRELEIPIHTIGMRSSANDVDEQELRNMANETGGFPAIGEPGVVSSLFRQAFSGLASEYRATADIFTAQGTHDGELHIVLRGAPNPPVPAHFEFVASRDYRPATPVPTATPTMVPVVMRVEPLQPDFTRRVYDLNIGIGNPTRVAAVVLTVEDSNGILAYSETVETNGAANVQLQIPMSRVRSGTTYVAKVQAVDHGNTFIQLPDNGIGTRNEDMTILVTKEFTHELPQPEPIAVEIQSIVADYASAQLDVELIVDESGRVNTYQGIIVDDETSQRIHAFGPEVFIGTHIVESLPDSMRSAAGPHTYRIVVLLTSDEGLESRTEAAEFTVVPPPRPGRMERLADWIRRNALWLALIAILLSAMIGWALWGKANRKKPFSLDEPIVEHTILGGSGLGESGRQPKLKIRVIQTPSAAERVEHIISTFPCEIGRASECQVHFTGDRQMSRQHARLERTDGVFYLSDLGSDNGTYIDDNRIPAKTPTRLTDVQNVRFGRQTNVDIRIQYF